MTDEIKIIDVPQTPGPKAQLCWQTPPLDGSAGNPMLHCDRRHGHTGLHSWQLATGGRSEGRATWQPIDVYLHEFDRHFANDSPLAAREYFADTIRLLLNRSTWQPISSAPKDKTWFLGWNSDCGVFVSRDGPGLLTGEDPAPTHWMPLPEGPKE